MTTAYSQTANFVTCSEPRYTNATGNNIACGGRISGEFCEYDHFQDTTVDYGFGFDFDGVAYDHDHCGSDEVHERHIYTAINGREYACYGVTQQDIDSNQAWLDSDWDCEHGLSGRLCAGPGHYPMDRY